MLSRRAFAGCAICGIGFGVAGIGGAAAQNAPAQTAGVTRKILSTTELPDGKYVAVQVEAEIGAGATVARHTHPGIESAFVLEGSGELIVDGRPNAALGPAGHFQVPAETPHSLKNGDKPMRLAITYTVEKGKPLASPAA
ncbi:MAG: cupin domain-containing protein [Methylobacteriaceae bacterium]|nr:cupin domain-containing protein [Methylobacteriaceae bacterium]